MGSSVSSIPPWKGNTEFGAFRNPRSLPGIPASSLSAVDLNLSSGSRNTAFHPSRRVMDRGSHSGIRAAKSITTALSIIPSRAAPHIASAGDFKPALFQRSIRLTAVRCANCAIAPIMKR